MGGKKTVYQAPPAPPTVGQSMAEYVKYLPQIIETQLKYAEPTALKLRDVERSLYPTTAGLQENLAQQATEGMKSEVPDWMKREYLSNLRASIGGSSLRGIGADYVSRGLLQQKQDWRNYYRNMAMSLAGRQPLINAFSGQAMQGGFTPGQVMNFNASTYSPYMSGVIANNQLGFKRQQWGQMQPFMWMQGVGNLMQGVGSVKNLW